MCVVYVYAPNVFYFLKIKLPGIVYSGILMLANLLGDMLSISIGTSFSYPWKMESKLEEKDNPCFQVHLAFLFGSLSLCIEGSRIEKRDNVVICFWK